MTLPRLGPKVSRPGSSQESRQEIDALKARIKGFGDRWDVRSITTHGEASAHDACASAAKSLLTLAGVLAGQRAACRPEMRHTLSMEVDWPRLLPPLLACDASATTCVAALTSLARTVPGLVPQEGTAQQLCALLHTTKHSASSVASVAHLLLLQAPHWRLSAFWRNGTAPDHILAALSTWLPQSKPTPTPPLSSKPTPVPAAVAAVEGGMRMAVGPNGKGTTSASTRAAATAGVAGRTGGRTERPVVAAAAAGAGADVLAAAQVLRLQVKVASVSGEVVGAMMSDPDKALRWLWALSDWLSVALHQASSSTSGAEEVAALVTCLLNHMGAGMWAHVRRDPALAVQLLRSLRDLLRVHQGSKQDPSASSHLHTAASHALCMLSHPQLWSASSCMACISSTRPRSSAHDRCQPPSHSGAYLGPHLGPYLGPDNKAAAPWSLPWTSEDRDAFHDALGSIAEALVDHMGHETQQQQQHVGPRDESRGLVPAWWSPLAAVHVASSILASQHGLYGGSTTPPPVQGVLPGPVQGASSAAAPGPAQGASSAAHGPVQGSSPGSSAPPQGSQHQHQHATLPSSGHPAVPDAPAPPAAAIQARAPTACPSAVHAIAHLTAPHNAARLTRCLANLLPSTVEAAPPAPSPQLRPSDQLLVRRLLAVVRHTTQPDTHTLAATAEQPDVALTAPQVSYYWQPPAWRLIWLLVPGSRAHNAAAADPGIGVAALGRTHAFATLSHVLLTGPPAAVELARALGLAPCLPPTPVSPSLDGQQAQPTTAPRNAPLWGLGHLWVADGSGRSHRSGTEEEAVPEARAALAEHQAAMLAAVEGMVGGAARPAAVQPGQLQPAQQQLLAQLQLLEQLEAAVAVTTSQALNTTGQAVSLVVNANEPHGPGQRQGPPSGTASASSQLPAPPTQLHAAATQHPAAWANPQASLATGLQQQSALSGEDDDDSTALMALTLAQAACQVLVPQLAGAAGSGPAVAGQAEDEEGLTRAVALMMCAVTSLTCLLALAPLIPACGTVPGRGRGGLPPPAATGGELGAAAGGSGAAGEYVPFGYPAPSPIPDRSAPNSGTATLQGLLQSCILNHSCTCLTCTTCNHPSGPQPPPHLLPQQPPCPLHPHMPENGEDAADAGRPTATGAYPQGANAHAPPAVGGGARRGVTAAGAREGVVEVLRAVRRQMQRVLGCLAAAVLSRVYGQVGVPTWPQLPQPTPDDNNLPVPPPHATHTTISSATTIPSQVVFSFPGSATQAHAHACMLASSPVLHARALASGPQGTVSLKAGVPEAEFLEVLKWLHTGTCAVGVPQQSKGAPGGVQGVQGGGPGFSGAHMVGRGVLSKLSKALGLGRMAALLKAVVPQPGDTLTLAHTSPATVQLLPTCTLLAHAHGPYLVASTTLHAAAGTGVGTDTGAGVSMGERADPRKSVPHAAGMQHAAGMPLQATGAADTGPGGSACDSTEADQSGTPTSTTPLHPHIELLLLHASDWHATMAAREGGFRMAWVPAHAPLPPACDLLLAVPPPPMQGPAAAWACMDASGQVPQRACSTPVPLPHNESSSTPTSPAPPDQTQAASHAPAVLQAAEAQAVSVQLTDPLGEGNRLATGHDTSGTTAGTISTNDDADLAAAMANHHIGTANDIPTRTDPTTDAPIAANPGAAEPSPSSPCSSCHPCTSRTPDAALLGVHQALMEAGGGHVVGAACSARWMGLPRSGHTTPTPPLPGGCPAATVGAGPAAPDSPADATGGGAAHSRSSNALSAGRTPQAVSNQPGGGSSGVWSQRPVVTLPEVTDVCVAWSLVAYTYTRRLYLHMPHVTGCVESHGWFLEGMDSSTVESCVSKPGQPGAETLQSSGGQAASLGGGGAVGGCSVCACARTCLRVAYCSHALLLDELHQLCRHALRDLLTPVPGLPLRCLLALLRDAALLDQAWTVDNLLAAVEAHALSPGSRDDAAVRGRVVGVGMGVHGAVGGHAGSYPHGPGVGVVQDNLTPEWSDLPAGLVAATAAALQGASGLSHMHP